MHYGFSGSILRVDLASGKTKAEEQDAALYRKYYGGSVMATYFLLKEQRAGIEALSPEAMLCFFPGLMSGFEAPGLARFFICGKSPLTDGIGEARCEGPFAVALKKTGYDGIIITGACQTPSILLIKDGQASVKPMPMLWGKSVHECERLLKTAYPASTNAIIGVAGENKVRFANVISDYCHEASRAGMGAVMGTKGLKAVVLVGGALPEVYEKHVLEQASVSFEERMHKNVLAMWQHDRPGFGVWIHTHGIDAALSVNNYQTAQCDYVDAFKPEAFERFYKGEKPCPYCPNNCIKLYATNDADVQVGGLHQEAIGALGPNIGNASIERLLEANARCNEYGMDPNALGYVISFAQECAQKGLIDAGGLNLSFTNDAQLGEVIADIATRTGIGDILAEGVYRAAQSIGNGAEQFAMHVKKSELTPIECRTQTNLALGFALAPVGPRYEICEHDWDFDTKVGWEHTLDYCRTMGILERVPMQYLGKEKVKNFKALYELWSAVDALGMCVFATAPTRVYNLEDIAQLLHGITGFETSSYEVMRAGVLRNHMFRYFNHREGITAKSDTLPDRFFEQEVDAGSLKGTKLDKAAFTRMLQFYYDMVGWDENGVPKESTLYDFGLEWLCAPAPCGKEYE